MTACSGLRWTRWYCHITHLTVPRGKNKDVASISRFADAGCTLWLYNTAQEDLWTADNVTYHKTVAEAMQLAETRYAVKALPPVS